MAEMVGKYKEVVICSDCQYVSLQKRRVVEAQLHVFCDASKDAFGTAAYVRYSFKDGSHECALVMSKSVSHQSKLSRCHVWSWMLLGVVLGWLV